MATVPVQAEPLPARPSIVPPPAPSKRTRSNWIRRGIVAGVALLLAAGGMLWRAHLQNVISYETVPVERGSVQSKVTATGTLNAVVDVLVSSQVSGNIKALYADWNSKVKKGQLVALIDPELFQAQVDQASATYRAAHSATLTAQAQREKTKSDLSAAVANEKNAEAIAAKDLANESNARVQWERAQQLFRAQVIAQQDYDTAKASYEAAVAQVSADRALIEAGKQNILSAQASVQVAQSQLESARAQEHQTQAALHQAEVNLDHTKIIAPVDGTVVARRMDVGQTVASTLNPPTIFEIAQDLTKMQVDTNVNESDVGNIAVGQKASFFVDAYPGATFQGVVADVRKAPIVAQNVVTYDVVIAVDNSSLKLFPGMTANVSILAARVDDTLKVPNSVLRFRPSADVLKRNGLLAPRPDQQQIYVLSGGKLQAAPVRFGISDGKYTAIVSGQVQAGAPVVIRAASSGSRASTTPMPPMGPRM